MVLIYYNITFYDKFEPEQYDEIKKSNLESMNFINKICARKQEDPRLDLGKNENLT